MRSQIFGIGARLVAPLKLILYFFGNLQAERFSILKILKDFSRFNRILGLEAHRFFGHEVHHFMGLKANIVTLRIQRNMRMWADDLCL